MRKQSFWHFATTASTPFALYTQRSQARSWQERCLRHVLRDNVRTMFVLLHPIRRTEVQCTIRVFANQLQQIARWPVFHLCSKGLTQLQLRHPVQLCQWWQHLFPPKGSTHTQKRKFHLVPSAIKKQIAPSLHWQEIYLLYSDRCTDWEGDWGNILLITFSVIGWHVSKIILGSIVNVRYSKQNPDPLHKKRWTH